jgi:asparagine synthase (glutamine-hydrolysing)
VGGLVGILGDGSLAEVQAMAARMPYRGSAYTWSPAQGVYFGELTHGPSTTGDGTFAIDTAGDATPRDEIEAAFRKDGAAAAEWLRGFFVIARWDDTRKQLELACDRNSYKSIYLAQLPGRVVFASDLKALLALSEIPVEVDRAVLQQYLRTRSFGSDRSLLKAAQPLCGPFVWTVTTDGRVTRNRYWQPHRPPAPPTQKPFAESAIELRGILQSVMSRQLLERHHVGIALSGGLDSVAVLGVARNVRPELSIASYTVGHSHDDPEIVRAREAAEHFGTEHHEIFLPLERIPTELAKLVWLTEDLTGREEAVLQQVLTLEMATRERCYLAGHGADAAFAGMPRHKLLWLRDHSLPPLRRGLEELFGYTQHRTVPSSWVGKRLASVAFRGDRPQLPSVRGAAPYESGSTPSLEDYWCSTISGRNEGMRFHEPLEATGNITMMTPFFDPSLVEFALTCPLRYLIGARQQKRILRAAVKDLLPPEMSRRSKLIQRLKHDSALSDVLDDFAKQLRLRESLSSRGLISSDYLAALQKRERGTAYSSERIHILWAMVCAELWLRQFIDERGSTGPELPKPDALPPIRLATA